MPDEESLFISLYTDADVDSDLAIQIRKQGFDAVSSREEKLNRLNDEAQLLYASDHRRAILTHNTKHFEPLHKKWQREGKVHWGIIISTQVPIGELLRRILRLFNTITADEMRNNIRYLSDFAERKKTK